MNPRSDIHDRLAASLREARKARGLSLDAVAKLSGVSRSMVSQIERGESSPTVATLWNLTQALQVDFAGLLEGRPAPGIEITRASAAPVIARSPGVRIRILSPAEAVGEHEVYDLSFEPGAALADLLAALNAGAAAGAQYAALEDAPQGRGTDYIRTAFIYRPARVTPVATSIRPSVASSKSSSTAAPPRVGRSAARTS